MIGSYNNYYPSSNGIPSGNCRWYSLVYLVYKNGDLQGQGPGNRRVALGNLLGRLTFWENVGIR